MNQHYTANGISAILGPCSVSENSKQVTIRHERSVTFQQLNQLSEYMETDSIDVNPGEDSCRWSSVTYEPGEPATIVVYK